MTVVSSSPTGRMIKHRNIFLVWLVWPLITLGIYHLVWWYKINAEIGRFDPRIKVSPALALSALLFGWIIVIPPFVSVYKTGKRISQAQQAAGVGASCSGVIGLILAFFLSLHTLYYQAELNRISDRYGVIEGTPVQLAG